MIAIARSAHLADACHRHRVRAVLCSQSVSRSSRLHISLSPTWASTRMFSVARARAATRPATARSPMTPLLSLESVGMGLTTLLLLAFSRALTTRLSQANTTSLSLPATCCIPDLLDATALGAVLSRRRREATGCSKGLFDRRFAYDWRLAADAVAAGRYYVAVASGIAIHADILDASALGDPLSRRRRESSDCSMVSFKSRFALG